MKLQKLKILTISLFLLQIMIFAQSSGKIYSNLQDTDPEPIYGGSLVDSSKFDAEKLNPVVTGDKVSHKVENLIFESLVSYDEDMNIIPYLAQSWEVSLDMLKYTFHLRQDVFWHDGEKFTADDVIFTLNRLLDPEATISRKHLFDKLRYSDPFIPPYKMEDNYTVVLNLVSSFPPMMSTIMFPIIPEHVYLNHLGVDGINHTLDDCRDAEGVYTFNDDPKNLEPIGTGPMMFSEWNLGRNITLIRNSVTNGGPGYWNEHDAYLDK